MKPGLVTLADLPALAAGKNPTSRITVARLGRYEDARYGKFEIGDADFEGWKRNLESTFGGKVSIDLDHSSDRGRGTAAAGWIVGLERQGKDVIASVEWTPKGAKAIRTKTYQFISPTFTEHYKDEQGVDRGRALLGAACTNRPVLRQLPTLSLSKDSFDGVATPRQKAKKKTMSKSKPKRWKTVVLDSGGQLVRKKLTLEQLQEEGRRVLARPPVDARMLAGADGSVDAVLTLAAYAPDGVGYAGTQRWDAPETGASRVPPGLDASGLALHAIIAQRAAKTGQPYLVAMSDVTGVPDYARLSDVPVTPVDPQGLDPDRAALYNTARGLASAAGIGWMDAAAWLDYQAELAQLQPGDGSGAVPWLDSRPISPPRPWSNKDWERDKRRARSAGLQVGALDDHGEDAQLKALWLSGAEMGKDVVGEMAAEQRAEQVAALKQRGEGILDQARAREDDRRSQAITDELRRRASNRLGAPGRASKLYGPFPS